MGVDEGRANPAAESVTCPFCDSTDTRIEQRKGSAICRIVYYCNACRNPFERMV